MLFMHVDISLAIAQKLALYYKVDDSFPALSAQLKPSNLEGTTNMNDIIGSRNLSDKFKHLFNAIRPGGKGSDSFETLNSFNSHLHTIGDVQELLMNVVMLKEKTDDRDKKSTKNGSSQTGASDQLKTMLADMWLKTDIINLTLISRRVIDDIVDDHNVTSLTKISKSWLPALDIEGFFNSYFSGFLIGDGTMDKAADTWRLSKDAQLNYTEVAVGKGSMGAHSFGFAEMMKILSEITGNKNGGREATASGMKFAEELIQHLTVLDCLRQVDKVAHHFAPIQDPTQSRFSNIKELNLLLSELDYVQDLLAMKTFNSLQAWVGITQRTLQPFMRDEAMDYIKKLFPTMAINYDMEAIFTEFLSLPIGPMTNDIVNSCEDVDSVMRGGSQLTTIISPYFDAKPEDGLDYYGGTIRGAISSLYPLLKQKELWELYRRGGVLLGAVPPTCKKVSRSLDSMPLVYSQFGSFSGNRINTMDDINWSFLFDWGVNKFNSSARTDLTWNEAGDDELILQYSYGKIDYQEYQTLYRRRMLEMVGSGISGFEFTKYNTPLLAIRRRDIKGAFPFLGIDTGLIKLGGSCLLPVPPITTNPVVRSAKTIFIDKEIIGAYETRIDKLPLTFTHTPPITDKPVALGDSTIPEYLKIAEANFNKSITVGTTLLKRFINKAMPGNINCSTITEDIFFSDMVSHMFISPCCWVSPKTYELYLRPFLHINEGEENIDAVMAKEVGVHHYIQGQGVLEKGNIGHRIMTRITALDRTDHIPKSKNIGYLNAEHGIIED